MMTIYDSSGKVLRRNVNFWNGRNPTFTYVDTNGDGLFDYLMQFNIMTNGYKRPLVFVRIVPS